MRLIDKDVIITEIEKLKKSHDNWSCMGKCFHKEYESLLSFLDTLEVKEIDLIIHTIIAECCDWLAMRTNLSYDEIEGCRNLMLIIKEEQFKVQKENKL